MIDGPTTGVKRQAISFKRASLTSLAVTIPRSIGSKSLAKALVKQDLDGKWKQTGWAKKIEKRTTRASLTDFDRFKLMLARKQKSVIVHKNVALMRKASIKK